MRVRRSIIHVLVSVTSIRVRCTRCVAPRSQREPAHLIHVETRPGEWTFNHGFVLNCRAGALRTYRFSSEQFRELKIRLKASPCGNECDTVCRYKILVDAAAPVPHARLEIQPLAMAPAPPAGEKPRETRAGSSLDPERERRAMNQADHKKWLPQGEASLDSGRERRAVIQAGRGER